MNPTELLSVETNSLNDVDHRETRIWFGHHGATVVRNYVTGLIVEQMVKEVNARYNLQDFPNHDQVIKEAQLRIGELRNFIKVFDEIQALNVLKKITISNRKL